MVEPNPSTSATVAAASPAEPPMIQAEGLVKHYREVRAVDGVTFSVERGEIVGFLGPNGAGKSTTMRMLSGYLHPDRGRASIGGVPLEEDPLAARSAIGYLPEHTPLYREMRVDRYLGFVASVRGMGPAARREAVARVLDQADLEGYTTRRIRTLSKGYRQRVGLAQALIADPDVLILDEPTSGLDPGEIVRIRDRIVELARTKTILLSTHVLPEVEEVCRRAIILAGGRIVADGPLTELAEEAGEALSVGLVLAATAEAEALASLASLEGVEHAEVAGRLDDERVRIRLGVEDRWDVAARVTALASERGWRVVELSHDVPTLERVFLERTRRLVRGAQEDGS